MKRHEIFSNFKQAYDIIKLFEDELHEIPLDELNDWELKAVSNTSNEMWTSLTVVSEYLGIKSDERNK